MARGVGEGRGFRSGASEDALAGCKFDGRKEEGRKRIRSALLIIVRHPLLGNGSSFMAAHEPPKYDEHHDHDRCRNEMRFLNQYK